MDVEALLSKLSGTLVNITGGTKPMSLAALIAAQRMSARPIYVRSQGAKTQVDLYAFDDRGIPCIEETISLNDTITIDDYLTVYFGTDYQFTGYSTGAGMAFEQAIHDVLEPEVDELRIGLCLSSEKGTT